MKKGPHWEARIVAYLRDHGVPHAERRVMGGGKDRGDVAGIPGVVVEAKNTAAVSLAAWVDEAEAERVNDGADLAVVWHHRRGRASPGDGYVTMTGAALVHLLIEAGYINPDGGPS
jgi:hypothetical protein